MAENITLARPYAEATFQLARDTKTLDAWQQVLKHMALVATDAQMRACIDNPKLTSAQLVQLFLDVMGGLTEAQKNFVQVLVDNERLNILPEIRDLFEQLKNEHEGVKQAQVTSAFPLDDRTIKQLVAELEPRFQCRLHATVKVDAELIGGVRIAVGDEVIDASVRGKLAAMANALKGS